MRIEWDSGPRPYTFGAEKGVLYLDEGAVAWSGLISVQEGANGVFEETFYFEGNAVYVAQTIADDFSGGVEAFMYPEIFESYTGHSEEARFKRFGLSYCTNWGQAEQLHLVYNVCLSPPSKNWKTVGQSVDPTTFKWDISSLGVDAPGSRPISHLILEMSDEFPLTHYLEDILYGTEATSPRLPIPDELVQLYEDLTAVRITYLGDGTYTAEGPEEYVEIVGDGSFRITAPTAVPVDDDTFRVSSYLG